ncbi:MAG: hypothetical protein QM737_17940 [Ferruginibacter sp.]
MKHLLSIILLTVCFTACKKDNNDLLQNDPANSKSSIDGLSPTPVPAQYNWSRLANPNNPGSDPGGINVIIPVNGAVYCIEGFYHFRTLFKLNINTKTWGPSNDFEIDAESQYLFSYGTKIYFGMMQTNANTYKGMHSVDVITGVKTTLASFPSDGLNGPTTFVIGNKGYLMGGTTYSGSLNSHIYEYNFLTNQWLDKGNNPFGAARGGASAYVIGNKAYLGLGYSKYYLAGQEITIPKNDWILYDPASNLSATKADFPGQKRYRADGFIMNDNIYLGFGYNNGYLTDFWKYNTSTNSWSQQDGWPGTVVSGNNYFGTFSLGNTGYMVKGDLAEFWKFSNSPYVIQ